MVSLLRQPDCKAKSSSWEVAWNTIDTTTSFSTYLATEFYGGGLVTIVANATIETVLTVPGNPTTSNPHYCCGPCNIEWDDVHVFYWVDARANTKCLSNIDTSGSNDYLRPFTNINEMMSNMKGITTASTTATESAGISSPPALAQRDQASGNLGNGCISLFGNDTVQGLVTAMGPGGRTFTSPYVYFDIPWAAAMDECSNVGSVWTSIQTSFLPEDVYSIVPQDISCFGAALMTQENSIWPQKACPMLTKQFNFADLPCPPDSLRQWASSSYIYNSKVPYLPFIAFPDITLVDPAWSTCVAAAGWDPFTALTPASALLVPPSTSSELWPPGPTAGQGVPDPTPSITPATAWVATSQSNMLDLKSTRPSAKPAAIHANPTNLASSAGNRPSDPIEKTEPQVQVPLTVTSEANTPSEPAPKTQVKQPDAKAKDTATAAESTYISAVLGSSLQDLYSTAILNEPHTPPKNLLSSEALATAAGHTTSRAHNGAGVVPGIPTISYDTVFTSKSLSISAAADGKVIPDPNPAVHISPSNTQPASPAITTDDHTISQGPRGSTIRVDGTLISYGAAITAGTQTINLEADGNVIINSNTVAHIPHAKQNTHTSIDNAPSGIVVEGSTVLDGVSITISGAVVAVASDGGFVKIASSTVAIDSGVGRGIGGLVWSAVGGSLAPTTGRAEATSDVAGSGVEGIEPSLLRGSGNATAGTGSAAGIQIGGGPRLGMRGLIWGVVGVGVGWGLAG
ncbi:MAG: hypothetical protein MMC23_002337 [Stictis urceolatum]|nr:hypothetical protein [Stictis urceolata]